MAGLGVMFNGWVKWHDADGDCQEGVKGAQGSVRVRNQDEEIKENRELSCWCVFSYCILE